jgi:hypothetical protein
LTFRSPIFALIMMLLPVISSAATTRMEFTHASDCEANVCSGFTWSVGDYIGYLTYDSSELIANDSSDSNTVQTTEITGFSMTIGTHVFGIADVLGSTIYLADEWMEPIDRGEKAYVVVEFAAFNGDFGFSSSPFPPLSEQGHLLATMGSPSEALLLGTRASVVPLTAAKMDVQIYADSNQVNPASNNLISLAVHSTNMGNSHVVDFDATQIDPSTLRFGASGAENVVAPWVADWDGDSTADDVAFGFRTQDTGIVCGDTEVLLNGETYAGDPFTATDFINTTDCDDGGGCHP